MQDTELYFTRNLRYSILVGITKYIFMMQGYLICFYNNKSACCDIYFIAVVNGIYVSGTTLTAQNGRWMGEYINALRPKELGHHWSR